MRRVSVQLPARSLQYEIAIGSGILSHAGRQIRQQLGRETQHLAVISTKKVSRLYASTLVTSLEAAGFRVSSWLMGDGEDFKNLETAKAAVEFLSARGLQRTDAVVSLGGGVTGDLAGFAAAIYLRGIALVHIPTTLLAQIDASIGGKTGVNLMDGKNRIGAFHQPATVIADIEVLKTLPERELTAGWCECVKQGAVANRKLFKDTTEYLAQPQGRSALAPNLEKLIAAQIAFKVAVVKADEREDTTRTDRRSRRILNFGHTVGHALEQLTNYRRFRHGEAVGYGMLAATELSKNVGLLDQSELESLRAAVALCGRLPPAHDIDAEDLIAAISQDKKSAGGRVQWVLLERIGRPVIVGSNEIDASAVKQSISVALQKTKRAN